LFIARLLFAMHIANMGIMKLEKIFNSKKKIKRLLLKTLFSGCAIFVCAKRIFQLRDEEFMIRHLSIDYGDGTCKWQPPFYEVPGYINFHKTVIVGYPSGDKRMTEVQMEALTGWSAKDEWEFESLGMSNHPFIMSNYPHHEGIWGWGDAGDQVIMVVRNMRQSMVEYHDILWDVGYAKTWADSFENIPNLYSARPPLEDFLVWRDLRVIDEIHWYGWFIDYWMEGGLLRDVFTNKITTPYHWNLLRQPSSYSKDEAAYDLVVGNATIVRPSYDPNCVDKVSGGCKPIQIISAENLIDHTFGPVENRKLAKALEGKHGIDEYLIDESIWECIWTELIISKKGMKTFVDSDGITKRDYNFSSEILEKMMHELDRLLTKYSTDIAPDYWFSKHASKDLVELLKAHKKSVKDEYDEVKLGGRKLTSNDFLGPRERERRTRTRKLRMLEAILREKGAEAHSRALADIEAKEKVDHSDFFNDLDKKLLLHRVDGHTKAAREGARMRKLNMTGQVD